MERKKYILFYLLPLFLYAGFIVYTSTVSDLPTIRGVVSQEPVPPGAWTGDEIEHIIVYALLALLFYRAVAQTTFQQKSVHLTLLFCFVFGFWNEIQQSMVSERTFSYIDMLWNVVGSLFVKML